MRDKKGYEKMSFYVSIGLKFRGIWSWLGWIRRQTGQKAGQKCRSGLPDSACLSSVTRRLLEIHMRLGCTGDVQ